MRYREFLSRYSCAGCGNPMEHAHHVRLGTGGGTGMKPGDEWMIPLCSPCHDYVHTKGQKSFEKKVGRGPMKDLAQKLYLKYLMTNRACPS